MSDELPPAQWWVSPWTEQVDDEQRDMGRRRVRLLHQMRRPLPLESDLVAATRSIDVRPFTTADIGAFLRVNNRAFAWHPDQGGWDADRLIAPMAEPWFDPEGFLLLDSAEAPGELDGFCWTKVHQHIDGDPGSVGDPDSAGEAGPAGGEIYVIGADPRAHGQGLGRALTVAGLQHLADRGLQVGFLYVEADNEPAVALYERLGFTVHHSDAGYAPAP